MPHAMSFAAGIAAALAAWSSAACLTLGASRGDAPGRGGLFAGIGSGVPRVTAPATAAPPAAVRPLDPARPPWARTGACRDRLGRSVPCR